MIMSNVRMRERIGRLRRRRRRIRKELGSKGRNREKLNNCDGSVPEINHVESRWGGRTNEEVLSCLAIEFTLKAEGASDAADPTLMRGEKAGRFTREREGGAKIRK